LLLGNKKYTEKADMWSVGCLLAELLDGCPLFAGSTDFDQIAKIGSVLGKPDPACFSETTAKLQFPDWKGQPLEDYLGSGRTPP
jgi:serine/threonine protein kinase